MWLQNVIETFKTSGIPKNLLSQFLIIALNVEDLTWGHQIFVLEGKNLDK